MFDIYALIWGLVGLGIVVLGVYLIIKDRSFKKNGVPVKLKVKEVKSIADTDLAVNRISSEGYLTTFEFDYNGTTIEKSLTTSKKFKVGSNKNGIYLPKGKANVLKVAGEGFQLVKGGGLFLISFGLLVMFLVASKVFQFPAIVILAVVLIYFAPFFLYPLLSSVKEKKNKKNDKRK